MTMAGRLAGKRILLVEDEYFIAADLKRALQKEEAVVVGPTGRLDQGLELAATETLDGAVLDVNLHDLMTYPLADSLAERDVPCMFVTGYDGWSMPEAYRGAPRLVKPFSTKAVLDTLADLVAEMKAT